MDCSVVDERATNRRIRSHDAAEVSVEGVKVPARTVTASSAKIPPDFSDIYQLLWPLARR